MNDLSIFVDESGDFGSYEYHAPYYLVTLVFHEQKNDESENIAHFDRALSEIGMDNHTVHAGPLIRREEVYINMTVDERMKIFNRAFNFMRKAQITYKTFMVEKMHFEESLDLVSALSKQMSRFFGENLEYFNLFDRIIIYYDNGQVELTKILVSMFHMLFSNVEYRQAKPAGYRLLQVADIICTMELCSLKAERKILSKSELSFFKSGRDLKKNYIKTLRKKEFMS